MFLEALCGPLSELFDHLVLRVVSLETFTVPRGWIELALRREALRMPKGPAAVECNVCSELLVALVSVDIGAVNPDYLTTPLADRKVVKALREAHQRDVLTNTMRVELASRICQLQADHEVLALLSLVGVGRL